MKLKNIELPWYAVVITILFVFKLFLFDHVIKIPESSAVILTTSLIYFIAIVVLINQVTHTKRKLVSTVFYIIMSTIMFIDAVYYQYFSNLPSFVVVKQITQLYTVKDSVCEVMSYKHIFFLVDIVPLILYLKFDKDKRMNNKKKLNISMIIINLVFFLIPFSVTYAVDKTTAVEMGKLELFTYHLYDVFECMLNKQHIYDVKDIITEMKKNNSTGQKYNSVAKNRNLIVIQVESLENFVINRSYNGQEITPNLNKLIQNNSIYYSKYYQMLGRGNTSDAEFVSNNSLYPAMDGITYKLYRNNDYYGLPWIMKDNGYISEVFHGYKPEFWNRVNAYPKQGFDKFISEKDFSYKESIGFGISDVDFLKQSASYMANLKKPFYSFLITLSNHHPYELPSKDYKLKLSKNHQDTLLGKYLESVRYTDEAIGTFIQELKKRGLYDNSIICIYGDHHGIVVNDKDNNKLLTDLLGHSYDFDTMMNIPLIMHIPGSGIEYTNTTVGGQIDFLPTLLNLMGIKNEKGIMFGHDLNNIDEGFVAEQTYMLKGSFITDEAMLEMSRDGIYEHSRAVNLKDKQPINIKNLEVFNKKAVEQIDKSNYIMRNNLIRIK